MFILSGAEDLVPILEIAGAGATPVVHGSGYAWSLPDLPRIEGLFTRI